MIYEKPRVWSSGYCNFAGRHSFKPYLQPDFTIHESLQKVRIVHVPLTMPALQSAIQNKGFACIVKMGFVTCPAATSEYAYNEYHSEYPSPSLFLPTADCCKASSRHLYFSENFRVHPTYSYHGFWKMLSLKVIARFHYLWLKL
jgi:hypothetical protein